MFKFGIRNRLIYAFLLLILTTLSLFGGYVLWYFYYNNLDVLTANLRTHAQITEQIVAEQMTHSQNRADIDILIKEIFTRTDLRITVVDPTGVVLADSWENPALMENHLERPEIHTALTGDNGSSIRYSSTLQQNMLYVSMPIRYHSELLGAVRVASSIAHVEAGFHEIRSAILLAIFCTAVLVVFLSIRLARRYTAPLEQITATAQKISAGNLNCRVHIRTGDELELLAHSLNQLTANLDDKINHMQIETRKLSLILKNMDNSVLLLDRYGRVTAANQSARNVFSISDDMIGQHNLQVIGNSLLDKAIQDTALQRVSRLIDLKSNLTNGKRAFQVFLAPLVDPENEITEVLTVFHDITTLQAIQERQAEFVANASHELATPLTAITGFAETLLDGAMNTPELSQKFITIIHTEAERMNRLIKELLQLAKLNSQEYRQQVKLEPTPLEPLLSTVVRELTPQANRKHQNITMEVQDLIVLANPDWLKQVVVNLLDNSIKYTPDQGTISLTCWQEADFAYVMIKDNGIGIPAKDLPLIFERFYRVDRARARTAGGTGLGLSIVKFIIEMHGGKIDIKSNIDSGTTVLFTLPLVPNTSKD